MGAQVNIRQFQIGDEAALFKVFCSAIHMVASKDYSSEQINAWAPLDLSETMWVEKYRAINPFVAEINGEPVGYADVQESGYIDHFFVSGNYPRQGIGSSLMSAIHNRAALLGIQELSSDVSLTAQPFFSKYGFNIVEHRFPEVRGVVLPNARMRKVLK